MEAVDSDALSSQEPLLIVISGPSGAGKDSVIQLLEEREFPFHFVVTATDREARDNEVHGEDYFFYSKSEFEQMVAEDQLLEHAVVYGQNKGVPREQVRAALASGKDVMMRLDVQGALTVRDKVPGAILIFITAESEAAMLARLTSRNTETEDELKLRIDTAREEFSQLDEFDYVVINRENGLDAAVDDILAIIQAEHCRVEPRKVSL